MYSYLPVLISKRKYTALFVLFSHRIVRWHTGYFQLAALLANVILVLMNAEPLYDLALLVQAFFYFLVITGWYSEKNGKAGFMYKPGKMAQSVFSREPRECNRWCKVVYNMKR